MKMNFEEMEESFYAITVPSSVMQRSLQANNIITQNMCNLSAAIVVNQEDCEQMEVHRSGWYVIDLSLKRKMNKINVLKLIYIIRSLEVRCNEILMSDDLLFNVINSLELHDTKFKSKVQLYLKNTRVKVNSDFTPNTAEKLTVCTIMYNTKLERGQIDIILMHYFQKPCYVCQGDVITINITDYIPEIFFHFPKQKVKYLYLKIVEIFGPTYNDRLQHIKMGYIVNNTTAIYQTMSQHGYVPPCKYCVTNVLDSEISNIKNTYPSLCPRNLMEKFEILLAWFQKFTKKECQDLGLNPFFLIHGPQGVGKSLLLSSACTYIGIRYVKFSCNNCEGLAPGQGEGKVKALFSQIKEHVPCILHLENVEALCYNADGDEDIRTLTCLQDLIQSTKFDFPMIVVATTSRIEAIKPSLTQEFLQTIAVEAPNTTERLDILRWIFHSCNFKVNDDTLEKVATQTAGFLLADLSELVAIANRERIDNAECASREIQECPEFEIDHFTSIISAMQSSYSEAIGAPKIPNVKWEDVGGLADLKKEILTSLQSTKWDSKLKRSGLLLHGPPGTGKTLLAKAVATECGRNFLSVRGPELLNMYVGQSEQNIRKVFDVARTASPCIIFFDELDSLAPNRGRNGDSGGVMDRVVSQLLAEMDGLSSSADVFILGATNRPDLIDPAIRRPGRLDKMLYVGLCNDRESQMNVFKALTRKFQLSADVDLPSIVKILPDSVSGADVYAVCSAAWVNAARRVIRLLEEQENHSQEKSLEKKSVIVEQNDFIHAVNSCKYTREVQ